MHGAGSDGPLSRAARSLAPPRRSTAWIARRRIVMKRLSLGIAVAMVGLAFPAGGDAQRRRPPRASSAQPRALVFRDVTVVDGTGADARPAMTVVVRDGRIESIGKDGQVS